jgi:hypothetical protein
VSWDIQQVTDGLRSLEKEGKMFPRPGCSVRQLMIHFLSEVYWTECREAEFKRKQGSGDKDVRILKLCTRWR